MLMKIFRNVISRKGEKGIKNVLDLLVKGEEKLVNFQTSS